MSERNSVENADKFSLRPIILWHQLGLLQMDLKNQLTTVTLANRLYVTLPIDCIGNPAGGVDLMLQTASWAGSILPPYDDLPNNGVVTLPSRMYIGDFYGDRGGRGQPGRLHCKPRRYHAGGFRFRLRERRLELKAVVPRSIPLPD